jgi:UDP-N-acetyl-D-glucosamine dehydrogenase
MQKQVCIQGLGFVGSAMAVACAQAGIRSNGQPLYQVVGLDLPSPTGLERIRNLNEGVFPFRTTDDNLVRLTADSRAAGNLRATSDIEPLRSADIVVVDVHFDIGDINGDGSLKMAPFMEAIKTLGSNIREGCLVIVETTVPPGTCRHVVRPALARCARTRGLPEDAFLLAHSYERVMPGDQYLASITDYWRVFAGDTPAAAEACEQFLSTVVNVAEFPLSRLSSTTASEISKALENTYRAVTIALMDEWGKFAEQTGVDLFEVVSAIRKRPTHSNMRQPGFGVGGYCLTKDPLFAGLAARDILGLDNLEFPLSQMAVRINQAMPLHAANKLRAQLGGLNGKRVLLSGISYRQDVADTRYSPSQTFFECLVEQGASVTCADPLVSYWEDLSLPVLNSLSSCPDVHAVVFAVPHEEYKRLEPISWLQGRIPYILDGNDCLSGEQRREFARAGCVVESIGRGT